GPERQVDVVRDDEDRRGIDAVLLAKNRDRLTRGVHVRRGHREEDVDAFDSPLPDPRSFPTRVADPNPVRGGERFGDPEAPLPPPVRVLRAGVAETDDETRDGATGPTEAEEPQPLLLLLLGLLLGLLLLARAGRALFLRRDLALLQDLGLGDLRSALRGR